MAAINKGPLFLPAGQEGTEGGPSKVVTVLKANTLPINLATFICASKQITKASLSPAWPLAGVQGQEEKAGIPSGHLGSLIRWAPKTHP